MPLYDHQAALVRDIYSAWGAGALNVGASLATGGGKTVVKAHVVNDFNDYAACLAHRRELVSQISLALAREGVRHRVVAPEATVKFCARLQVDRLGRSLVYPDAKVGVVGVDSLQNPAPHLKHWCQRVGLWLQDEAHHLLRENKWGRAVSHFPNAKGLGVSATWTRSDGKGLGRHAHGLIDTLVEGKSTGWLIANGYLSPYKIVAPPFDASGLTRGASGEYTPKTVEERMQKSRVFGDLVPTWERHALGLKTIVFAHSVDAAGEIADAFIARGVRAAVCHGAMNDAERVGMLRQFELGALTVLVNVDLFGEGFDVPALECVVFARPTASLGLYLQQFGRVLRVLKGKTHGLVIDHVGNVERHLLPDTPRTWSLDARDKRTRETPPDALPLRTCANVACLAVFERHLSACPHCGHCCAPTARGGPEQVDGDLHMLDDETLARLRGAADAYNLTPAEVMQQIRDKYGPPVAQVTARNRHQIWLMAQSELRAAVEQWSGYKRAAGLDDREICRLYYLRFGVDILSAYGLKNIDDIKSLTGATVSDIVTTHQHS